MQREEAAGCDNWKRPLIQPKDVCASRRVAPRLSVYAATVAASKSAKCFATPRGVPSRHCCSPDSQRVAADRSTDFQGVLRAKTRLGDLTSIIYYARLGGTDRRRKARRDKVGVLGDKPLGTASPRRLPTQTNHYFRNAIFCAQMPPFLKAAADGVPIRRDGLHKRGIDPDDAVFSVAGSLFGTMPSTAVQKGLLVLSVFLILCGIGLTIVGAFSPAWQVVDIREFRAEHQHGLWWDCVRAEKHVVAVGDFYDEEPLHCMYKFDNSAELVIEKVLIGIDEDGAAGEAEHHRFWIWHKVILFFIISSEFLAFFSICTGVCAPCFRGTTFAFTITLFVALLCSMIADGVFFLAANRVDNRFVQGMVGTYEQQIGYAFYVHLLGTLAWLFAFLCAMVTTYKFFSDGGQGSHRHQFDQEDHLLDQKPYRQPYPRFYRETSA